MIVVLSAERSRHRRMNSVGEKSSNAWGNRENKECRVRRETRPLPLVRVPPLDWPADLYTGEAMTAVTAEDCSFRNDSTVLWYGDHTPEMRI